jgi:hypothetical protein
MLPNRGRFLLAKALKARHFLMFLKLTTGAFQPQHQE